MIKAHLINLAMALALAGVSPAASAQAAQAPDASTAPVSPAAATVNGVAIPQAELDRMVQADIARGAKDDTALRARLRERLISQELFYQEALKRRIDQSPQYKAALRSAERSLLEMFLLQSIQAPPVAEADVRAAYNRTIANLAPNDFRLDAIVVPGEAQVRQVWSQLARGAEFEGLARANSILPSARAGGSLGWTNLRTDKADKGLVPLPPAVASAARRLAKGGMTQPVADGNGRWWIVRVIDTRPSNPMPYEQASGPLRAALENAERLRAQRNVLEGLRKGAVVK